MHLLALGLALLLTACAASLGPPAPAGALPRSAWAAPPAPRAVILAVHGFNDHHTAFTEFAAWAAARDFLVVAYDQRGFGQNPGRGLWAGTGAMAEDLRGEIGGLTETYPGTPIVVLGESMGAAVAIVALAGEVEPAVAGLVLSAPAVWGGSALNPFYRATLWLLRTVAPGMTLTGRGLGRRPTDNVEVLRKLSVDPLFIKETRVDAIGGLVDLMTEARGLGPRLTMPTLVLVGEHDEIVPVEAQLSFAATLPADSSRLIVYPEGWHLLLRDLQRERVWQDILAWIEALPAVASPAARLPAHTQPPSAT